MSEYLSTTPVNNSEFRGGGIGCKLTFEDLYKELIKKGVMKEGEVFSQVNVCEDGLVFYFKEGD